MQGAPLTLTLTPLFCFMCVEQRERQRERGRESLKQNGKETGTRVVSILDVMVSCKAEQARQKQQQEDNGSEKNQYAEQVHVRCARMARMEGNSEHIEHENPDGGALRKKPCVQIRARRSCRHHRSTLRRLSQVQLQEDATITANPA